MTTIITPALDKIESTLPPIPRSMFRLNRALTRAWFDMVRTGFEAVSTAGQRVGRTGSIGAKTVTGQAKAQVARTVQVAEDEVTDLLDSAQASVEDAPSGSYESWTRAELYERAQELDIEGRSSMSKAELIRALRS